MKIFFCLFVFIASKFCMVKVTQCRNAGEMKRLDGASRFQDSFL